MTRVRFAPSPTGSLHVGNALSAVANRRLGDWMLLRIDDTDAARTVAGGESAILADLAWLGVAWDEGPVRQSERQQLYRAAAERLGGDRFDHLTLLREDGTATYHLASVVDDAAFGITHVVRGNDHRPNEELHRRLHEALGTTPPEYVHHGLVLRPDGAKLSKRDPFSSVADLRETGIPAEAVRAYLEELGIPKHDVRYDLKRISLVEAREFAEAVLVPPVAAPTSSRETLARFRELQGSLDARGLLRELTAVGGDLKALRLALTGRDHGPELWAVLAALGSEETMRRIDAAL